MENPGETSRPSRGAQAYERIKAAIETGDLAPGSRVREVELARELGISRTPVREALRRLEGDGLITHAPRRGTIVAELDHQAIIELYSMREVLESTAAGLAARHASEAEIDELTDIVETEADYLDQPRELARLNKAFHGMLYHAAHNRYLLKALFALSDAMTLLGGTTMAVDGRPITAHEEHRIIVAALRAHDRDAAMEGAARHIRQAHRTRLKLLRDALLSDPAGTGPGDS